MAQTFLSFFISTLIFSIFQVLSTMKTKFIQETIIVSVQSVIIKMHDHISNHLIKVKHYKRCKPNAVTIFNLDNSFTGFTIKKHCKLTRL